MNVADGVKGWADEEMQPRDRFARLVAEYEDRLRSRGHVDATRPDLMSIAEIGRDELAHSLVIRWLFDPQGSHGLGSAVLRRVLTGGWGADAAEGCERARVHREQRKGNTQADVIVDIGRSALIVENKVDAPEQPTQCDDFVRRWGTHARYLFLSPHGGPPVSTRLPASRAAWRWLAYGSLARLLVELLPGARGPGRAALQDYIQTLDRQFGSRSTFEIHREDDMAGGTGQRREGDPLRDRPDLFDSPTLRFFIEHQRAIKEIGKLEVQFASVLKREVHGLLAPIQEVLVERHGPVSAGLCGWNRKPAHPTFWSPRWIGSDATPLATIGLSWDGTDVEGLCLYSGIFVRDAPAAKALRTWLEADLPEPPVDGWEQGLYPVAYRYVEPMPVWWERLPDWRGSLVEAVDEAWVRFAPRVDVAFEALGLEPGRLQNDPSVGP